MNKSAPKFTRAERVWFVEVILTAALDRIESCLPDCIDWNSWQAVKEGDWISACLDTAGMTLAIFYAQQTDDGLSAGDALMCANDFDEACYAFLKNAWKRKGSSFQKQTKARINGDNPDGISCAELYQPYGYPDCAKHAESFVAAIFDKP